MKLSRRDAMRAGAVIAAGAALSPWTGSASAQAPARNLIIVLARGGWDTTYALDPKPGSVTIDAPEGAIERFGEVAILGNPSRPSVSEFFRRYAALGSVVNGVQVRSFVHSDCIKRMLTGTPSDTNPDLGAIVAYEHGRDLPVPYLVLGNSALSGPLAAYTARAGTTNQIATLLNEGAATQEDMALSGGPAFLPTSNEDALVARYLNASADRVRAVKGQRGANGRELEAFVQSLERGGLLRQFAKGGYAGRDYTPDLAVQVDVAVRALERGLCRAVMMETGDFDTHQNNEDQSARHESLFSGLLALNERLASTGQLDRTVVVVLSEMGRTPKLNSNRGKDHWPVTSTLVYGAGVRGGRVIGQTNDQLDAVSLDLATGAPNPNGKQLQTANLLAGILELVGVEPGAYLEGVEPFRALA
jgi:uncharacterized protein (DUF1501 family)